MYGNICMDFIGLSEADALKSLLQGFTSQKHVRKTLKSITEYRLLGCEKWFQIELYSYFLNSIPSGDVYKEDFCENDKRHNPIKAFQRIDLTYRLKHRTYYTAIEIKCFNHLPLANIRTDLTKLAIAKPSYKSYYKQVFSVLFHPYMSEQDIVSRAEKQEMAHLFEFTYKIYGLDLSCTAFSSRL